LAETGLPEKWSGWLNKCNRSRSGGESAPPLPEPAEYDQKLRDIPNPAEMYVKSISLVASPTSISIGTAL